MYPRVNPLRVEKSEIFSSKPRFRLKSALPAGKSFPASVPNLVISTTSTHRKRLGAGLFVMVWAGVLE
jgi:hypothetical protein